MPDSHLEPNHRATIEHCLESIAQLNPAIAFTAVLVGSVVRGRASERSDIDLVLLAPVPLRVVGCDPRVHVQAFTREAFSTKLRTGDDFAAWCVRLGAPVEGYEADWHAIVSSPDASTWPDWRQKVTHATRRLILADDMRRLGDFAATSEESLYAAAHISRAILLRAGIFPLSRPELVSQLAGSSHPVLSEMMRRLLRQDEDARFLHRVVRYLKRVLIDLDRTRFRALAVDHLREMRTKGRARTAAPEHP